MHNANLQLTFTRGGPPKYNDPILFTMTASCDIVGIYAAPAVQEPHTKVTTGIPFDERIARFANVFPPCSLSAKISSYREQSQ